jgi:hypothetical protein
MKLVWQSSKSYPVGIRLVLLIYVVAFSIGTATHLISILNGWWLPHHPLVNSYWASLVLLDPLAIVLLLKAPKAGLLLALVIMVTDVGINSAVSYMYLDRGGVYAVNYFVQLQSVFLGFLLGSAPFVGRYVSRQDAA